MPEKKTFSHFCRATFLSCERYTYLASRSIEEPLSLKEKIQFWSHHMLCMVCRRFRRQIQLLEIAAKRYESSTASDSEDSSYNDIPLGAEVTLPQDVRDRIETKLKEESHSG